MQRSFNDCLFLIFFSVKKEFLNELGIGLTMTGSVTHGANEPWACSEIGRRPIQ